MEDMHIPSPSVSRADAAVRRRLRAATLFARRVPQAEVARQCGVTRAAVCQWYAVWKRRGRRGLGVTRQVGRPSRLTAAQRRRIVRALERGPRAAGFATELWTLERVAALIAAQTRIAYHPGHVWRLLRQCGWTCQKPETRARERNEAAITRWIRTTWPRIQKKGGG